MAKREIGLMGYIGEAVVEQWLRWKYPAPEFEVISQIIPADISPTGGGYLDFGVIQNQQVIGVYEVKSQDYILDKNFPINQALLRIWKGEEKPIGYKSQDGAEYFGDEQTMACLVSLVGPNQDFMNKIGHDHLTHIILFQDIWDEFGEVFEIGDILRIFSDDAEKVISMLRNPTQGKKITPEFLKIREDVESS